MHLLEVGVHWPPETFLRRKLEGLAAGGMRVTVAANAIRDADAELAGVELIPPARAGSGLRDALALLVRSPRRLARLLLGVRRVPPGLARRHGGRRAILRMCLPLARLRPDVVQFEWNVAAVDHLPLFAVWDCPVVTSCRGSDLTVYPHVPALAAYAAGLPEVLGRASAVHCVSESLVAEAARHGLDIHKARVIRPAVDPAAFHSAAGRAGGAFRVLMVSELRWEKGYEYALGAARELVDKGVPLALELLGGVPPAGSSERNRIAHTVADLGLERHVTLAGAVSPEEVGRRLARADVLLQSSLAEGIPNTVLEAMACGLPVVTSEAGSVTEAVSDGIEGFVVEPRSAPALAQALLRLWRDPALRRRMGVAGRERVRSGFTLERQLQDFLSLYGELTAAR
jgi:glycosyltransferase involved in cell wall biosynthesis